MFREEDEFDRVEKIGNAPPSHSLLWVTPKRNNPALRRGYSNQSGLYETRSATG